MSAALRSFRQTDAYWLFSDLSNAHRRRLRVHWSMYSAPTEIEFCNFINRGEKGNGAIALREVCALADQIDFTIVLYTFCDKLKNYYEQFGFVVDREDDKGITRMVRPVQQRREGILIEGDKVSAVDKFSIVT